MNKKEVALGGIMQRFFMERLIQQQNASSNTVSSYRDMWRLFLHYLTDYKKMDIDKISLYDLTAEIVLDFLDYLEIERNCSIRSRNQRLAALKSFFHFVIFVDPLTLNEAQRILNLPMKRYTREVLGYLEKTEMEAILNIPDRKTRFGRKVYALLMFMYNTGARVSEVTNVKTTDFSNISGKEHVLIHGKGNKDRLVPLRKITVNVLKNLAAERESDKFGNLQPWMFLNEHGHQITRSGISYLLQTTVEKAACECHSLKNHKITPHVIRHTTAMHLLQSGNDINLVRMWLGHIRLETTHQYAESNIDMKRSVLTKGSIFSATSNPSYRPSAAILEFLDDLT